MMGRAMFSVSKRLFSFLVLAWMFANYAVAASALYETGPEQDASFVRFVNASDIRIVISNSKTMGKLELGVLGESRVSAFLPVKAGARLVASVIVDKNSFVVEVTAKPGEFITVAVVQDGANGWKAMQLRETPTTFSSTRSSLAAFNFDMQCASAQINSVGKNDGIKNVTNQAIKRRFVGQIKAQVQIYCSGKAVAEPWDMGQLEAGERYSIFIMPARTKVLFVKDEIAGAQ